MKNKAFDARSHAFTAGDQILPDANFWVFLYGPAAHPGNPYTAVYSGVLAKLLNVQARLFVDVLVLSEFVNVFARLEYRRLAPGIDFKPWRNTPGFKPVAAAIEQQSRQLLLTASPIDHAFSLWNLSDLLVDFGKGGQDVNDQLLVETCRKNGLSLLTNDTDFTEGGIKVFTAHNRLLAACPP